MKKLFRDGYMSISRETVQSFYEDEFGTLDKTITTYTPIYTVMKAYVDVPADTAEYNPLSGAAYRNLNDAIHELDMAVQSDCNANDCGYVKIDIYENACLVALKNGGNNTFNGYKILRLRL